MRINILADKQIQLEEHPEVKITIGALTLNQFKQQKALLDAYYTEQLSKLKDVKNFTLAGASKWFEFVCRHGIRSVEGIEYEKNGVVTKVELEYVDDTYGLSITKKSWGQLFPFLDGEIPTITQAILDLFVKKS